MFLAGDNFVPVFPEIPSSAVSILVMIALCSFDEDANETAASTLEAFRPH